MADDIGNIESPQGMARQLPSGTSREAGYWRACLIFLAATPFAALSLMSSGADPGFPLYVFHVGIGSILLSIAINLVTTRFGRQARERRRVWIVHPNARTKNVVPGRSPQECAALIRVRLSLFECLVWDSKPATAESVNLQFQRTKSPMARSFVENTLDGRVAISKTPNGSEVEVEATVMDTLVVDTGELAGLDDFASHLSLRDEKFEYRTIPFTLVCGVNLAFVTVLDAGLGGFAHIPTAVLSSLAVMSAGMIVISLAIRESTRFLGWRIGIAGLVMSATPLVIGLPRFH